MGTFAAARTNEIFSVPNDIPGQPNPTPSNPNVNFYIGCQHNGGGWSSLGGTVRNELSPSKDAAAPIFWTDSLLLDSTQLRSNRVARWSAITSSTTPTRPSCSTTRRGENCRSNRVLTEPQPRAGGSVVCRNARSFDAVTNVWVNTIMVVNQRFVHVCECHRHQRLSLSFTARS